jgi:hypothetical protein
MYSLREGCYRLGCPLCASATFGPSMTIGLFTPHSSFACDEHSEYSEGLIAPSVGTSWLGRDPPGLGSRLPHLPRQRTRQSHIPHVC